MKSSVKIVPGDVVLRCGRPTQIREHAKIGPKQLRAHFIIAVGSTVFAANSSFKALRLKHTQSY